MKQAQYYLVVDEYQKKLQCRLCPHNCLLKVNEIGKCKIRKNINGILYSLSYGVISSVAFDPIEKKPLYHFYPSSIILSVGSFGCNFKCDFCQNWEISQVGVENVEADTKVSPEELLKYADSRKNNIGISYTYNEPLINFEFVLETAKIFHSHNYKNVLVTNGYINKEPLLELLTYIDAANIDLKSFNKDFYKKICDGNLNFVLQTIELMLQEKKHVELTTLVIPGYNDSEEEIKQIVEHVSSLSKDIPMHFSRYYPMYKFTTKPTDIDTLIKIYNIAKEKLNYVYLGNILDESYNSTYCPSCKKLIIRRAGYKVEIVGIDDGKCKYCENKIAVVV